MCVFFFCPNTFLLKKPPPPPPTPRFVASSRKREKREVQTPHRSCTISCTLIYKKDFKKKMLLPGLPIRPPPFSKTPHVLSKQDFYLYLTITLHKDLSVLNIVKTDGREKKILPPPLFARSTNTLYSTRVPPFCRLLPFPFPFTPFSLLVD